MQERWTEVNAVPRPLDHSFEQAKLIQSLMLGATITLYLSAGARQPHSGRLGEIRPRYGLLQLQRFDMIIVK